MATFGGRPEVSFPPSGGGGPAQRKFAGAICTLPFSSARRALWPSSRKVNGGVGVDWGIYQPALSLTPFPGTLLLAAGKMRTQCLATVNRNG